MPSFLDSDDKLVNLFDNFDFTRRLPTTTAQSVLDVIQGVRTVS